MGLLTPNSFIALAEETGLIVDIDKWMIEMSIKQFKKWYNMGLNPKILSINISFVQLEKDDFLETLERIMRENSFSPEWLELEITERQVMQKPKDAIEKLIQISKLGIAIAIDDFGTEYSSLSYLKKLPIDKLKIDKSFIDDILNNREDKAITKIIIILAQNLNLDVIAEGVERLEQKEFLLKEGCNLMQGYYFSHPIDTEEIEKRFLLKNKGD